MRTRSRASSTIAKEALPVIESEGIRLRLVLGQAYGETVPASVFSDTFYADVQLKPGARIPLPDDHEERELYILEGSVSVAGQSFESGRMMFRPKHRIGVAAGPQGARGSCSSAARHIWWNFVASSQERPGPRKSKGAKRLGPRPFDPPMGDRDEFIPYRHKPWFDASDTCKDLSRAGAGSHPCTAEVRGSNPLSSTRKSARTALGSWRPQSLDY
jgi:Pirin C-terminal cupin domain